MGKFKDSNIQNPNSYLHENIGMSKPILITFSEDIKEKLKGKDFYKDIPILNEWSDYILEEIEPGCKIPISRVENIKSLIDFFADEPNFIYRGQDNPLWKLRPTLHRKFIGGFPNRSEIIAILEEFRAVLLFEASKSKDKELHVNSGLYLDIKKLEKLDEQSLWELGQHYGLNTEYLDWTLNINKALFFAMEPESWYSKSPYRVIYALNKEMPAELSNLINILTPKIDENLRMLNQEGLFTKITIDRVFEKIVSDNIDSFHNYFRKIYVFCNHRKEFLEDLDSQKINFLELFTGIEGVIRHCNSGLFTRAYGQGSIISIEQKVAAPKKLKE